MCIRYNVSSTICCSLMCMVAEIKCDGLFVWWLNCIFVLAHSSVVSSLRVKDQSCECSDFKKNGI